MQRDSATSMLNLLYNLLLAAAVRSGHSYDRGPGRMYTMKDLKLTIL